MQEAGTYLKDLSKLGREIERVIIVDNVPANFRLQKENGIVIRSWMGNKNDKELMELSKMLIGDG